MATKIAVERHITQISDGKRYEGYVQIAGSKLDYELTFGVPIRELDSQEQPKDESEIRRLFRITVKRGGANIELTEQEYVFFISMIAQFAVDFYNDPQTRDNNAEGMMGNLVRAGEPEGDLMASVLTCGLTASIGMTSTGSCDFPPHIREMLSAPKFGCDLATT
jgi:hypothetical protein